MREISAGFVAEIRKPCKSSSHPAHTLTHFISISGVQCYVIGIGNQINHNELVAIASRPTEKHLFEVEDYSMMLEIAEKVRESEQVSED